MEDHDSTHSVATGNSDDDYTLQGTHKQKALFADANEMKAKLHEQLSKPEYNVAMHYHKHGWAQKIARSAWFEHLTLFFIILNALWIFVDTDYNPSPVLAEAPIGFQIVEQLFCFYFVFEWLVRFMAFKRKLNGMRDAWFVFDTLLTLLFVVDSWILYLYMSINGGTSGGGLGDASILRIFRLLRLTRMGKMARFLRALPELGILLKGMGAAMRSVGFTLALLFVLLYIFGIAFRHLCTNPGQHICSHYFSSVPKSAHTLLIHGTLMDNIREVVIPLEEYSFGLLLFFYFFMYMAALTVMNLLIGLFCDVVNTTASVEKESVRINYVKERLQAIMLQAGMVQVLKGDSRINEAEFLQIIQNKAAAQVLAEVGVDVVGLIDFADFIFKEDVFELEEGEVKTISFADFVEVVLELRGNNNATVRDVVDLRKFVQLKVANLETKLDVIASYCKRSNVSKGATRLSRSGTCSKLQLFSGTPDTADPSSPTSPKRSGDEKAWTYESIQDDNATADSSPLLERKDATAFSDLGHLIERMVVEHQNALAILQRGNERLQAELDLLKSPGRSAAPNSEFEGERPLRLSSVSFGSNSLASLQSNAAAAHERLTAEEFGCKTSEGNNGNNHAEVRKCLDELRHTEVTEIKASALGSHSSEASRDFGRCLAATSLVKVWCPAMPSEPPTQHSL